MSLTLSIALTGGIGSGKSSVSSIFEQLGAPVIDADMISQEITSPNMPCFKKIIEEFGSDILTNKGEINRSKLSNTIFNDNSKRIKLEKIIHPEVFKKINAKMLLINYPYCLVVIPLLIETKTMSYFDRVLVIDSDENKQIERVLKRDKISKKLLSNIMETQINRAERLKYADDIIENNGEIKSLNKTVKALHQKYLAISNQKFG